MQEEQLPENVTSSMTEAMSGGGGHFRGGFLPARVGGVHNSAVCTSATTSGMCKGGIAWI